jgi:Na+/H+ antiporter NhaD/arsenite permease-like protein
MHFAIPKGQPHPLTETFPLQRGAKTIVVLYLATIVTSALLSSFWDVPPVFGMMVGLTYLQFYSYYLQVTHKPGMDAALIGCMESAKAFCGEQGQDAGTDTEFDVFHKIAKVEWDTLLFFYGVMLSVGGLKFIGYLGHVAGFLYGTTITPTEANTLVGVVSAFIDNSTVMFAILSMNPELSLGQWLLVTLTAGVGGSLLSFGSAAGVALMGQSKGLYNFTQHLIWAPAIAVGFAGSIAVHLWLNHNLF